MNAAVLILNEWGQAWAGYFGVAVLQNTVVLAAVLVALRLMRRSPAGVRHAVAVVGLLKLLLPPFLPLRLGGPATVIAARLGRAVGAEGFTAWWETAGGAARTTAMPAAAGARLDPAAIAFLAWGVVACVLLAWTVRATVRLARDLRAATPAPGAGRYEQETGVQVMRSERIVLPLALWLVPGRVFVPPAWDGWTDECRRMVVRHEAAHLRRLDGLVQALQRLVRALYFFHPLVWVLDRRLEDCREMACDDDAVGPEHRAGVAYSRYLVEIAESLVRPPAPGVPASSLIGGRNGLLRRVRYRMEEDVMRSMSRKRRLLAVCVAGVLALSLSWYGATAQEQADPPPPPPPAQPEREPAPLPVAEPAPPAASEPAAAPAPLRAPAAVSIVIMRNDVFVDDERVEIDLLADRLERIAADAGEKAVVEIVAADDVPMEQVHAVHRALVAAGLSRVRYDGPHRQAIPLVLPPPAAAERIESLPAKLVIDVLIGGDGRVSVDGETVEMERFVSIVEGRLVGEGSGSVVRLRSAPDAPKGAFQDVLEALNEAGANRVFVDFLETPGD